jgi:hypothetical protein
MGVLCFQSAVLDLRLGPGHVVRVQLDARDSVEVCVTPITPNASAPLAPPGNTRTHTLSAEPRGTAHPHKYDHVYVAYWCPAPIAASSVSVMLPIWHCPIADPPPPLHVPAPTNPRVTITFTFTCVQDVLRRVPPRSLAALPDARLRAIADIGHALQLLARPPSPPAHPHRPSHVQPPQTHTRRPHSPVAPSSFERQGQGLRGAGSTGAGSPGVRHRHRDDTTGSPAWGADTAEDADTSPYQRQYSDTKSPLQGTTCCSVWVLWTYERSQGLP